MLNTKETSSVIDVRIFPYRFLKPTTAEKILNKIYNLEGKVRVLIHGPSLPKKINYGPAKGLEVNHQDRKTIKVHGEDVDLRLNVGEIIITVELKRLNDFLNQLEDILNENMPCDYIQMIGIFTKTTATVSDYLKYGENFENILDQRYIGMVDPSTRSSDSIKIINSN